MENFFKKFKKPLLLTLSILVLLLIFSQTTVGKRILLPAGLIEAVRNFFASNPQLHACDYKEGEILLIKPVATGVGDGRYEAGDIIEIRDGEVLCQRFGDRDFLGKSEKTNYLIVYLKSKLTDKQKEELTESEERIIRTTEEGENITEMAKRRKAGVDYAMFLSDSEILKGVTLEKLDKIPEIDLSPVIEKSSDQKSVVRVPEYIVKIEAVKNYFNKIARKLIPPVFAQSTITKVVDPDNGDGTDYISLNSWEAQNLDLISLNQIQIATCRSTGGTADTGGAVSIGGWETDETRYIKVWTDPAEGYRHKGKWDDTKYRLVRTNGSALSNTATSTIIDGLQVKMIANDGGDYRTTIATDRLTYVSNNIVVAVITGDSISIRGIFNGATVNTTAYVWNNIVYGFQYGANSEVGIGTAATGANLFAYNNTVANSYFGFYTNGGTMAAKNNISYGNIDNWYGTGLVSGTSTNNLSGPGADAQIPGANPHNAVNLSFVSQTPGSEDFHLASGDTNAIGLGADLSTDPDEFLSFSDDIDGQARPSGDSWDIGADEFRGVTFVNSPRGMTESLSSGLVGYWSFNGQDMDATTTYDRSGNNNDGDVQGGATPAPGISGQALSFDGVDDIISIDSSNVGALSDYTVALWVKVSNTGDEQGLVTFDTYDPSWQILKNNYLCIYDGGLSCSDAQGLVGYNVWSHVAFVRSGTTVSTYINGVFDGTLTHSAVPLDVPALITMGHTKYLSEYLKGILDEVRIYNRALSASEILDLYRAGAGRLKVNSPITNYLTSGLVGNWTFDGQNTIWSSGTTGTTTDLSGNNNDGTLTDMNRGSSPAIGISGQALEFDYGGVADYVLLPKNMIAGLSAITMSAWVKPKVADSTSDNFFIDQTSGSPDSLQFFQRANEEYRCVIKNDAQISASVDSAIFQDTNWHHVVCTYNGAEVDLFVDGNIVVSDNPLTGVIETTPNDNLTISDTYTSNSEWDGLIDEVRIYNRALSASEISDLYRAGARTVKFKQ